MNVIVCIKQVPSTSEVEVDPVTGVLKRDGTKSKMNPYDLFALEAALSLKERYGGTVTALSMGPTQAKEVLYEALYMGADSAVLASDRRFGGADVLATSYTLSQCVRKLGEYDIIICGKQTTDGDTAQVGPEMAEMLGIPHACNVLSAEWHPRGAYADGTDSEGAYADGTDSEGALADDTDSEVACSKGPYPEGICTGGTCTERTCTEGICTERTCTGGTCSESTHSGGTCRDNLLSEGAFIAKVNMDDSVYTLRMQAPCLLTVDKDINTPRLPSYLRRQKVGDAQVSVWSMEDLLDQDETHYGLTGSATKVEKIFPPETNADRERFEGSGEEVADRLYSLLKEKKRI